MMGKGNFNVDFKRVALPQVLQLAA